MDKALKVRVSKDRLRLGNPYAHLEYLQPDGTPEPIAAATAKRVHESRMALQDPYAFLDDEGGYSAAVSEGGASSGSVRQQDARSGLIPSDTARGARLRRRKDKEIEAIVKDLHTRVWRERGELWDGMPPADPIELLDPEVALRAIGYECSLEEGLGTYRTRMGSVEVAGLINRTTKTVHLSRQFPMHVRTFTAAHELGHAVLHPAGGGVHRDRPIDGTSMSRDPREVEADRFATYFLMPEKLVRARFATFFGSDRFKLNDDTAFALCGASVADIRAECRTRRDLSRMLASAERYGGRHFLSLATQFHVSAESMAIRLEELGLLE